MYDWDDGYHDGRWGYSYNPPYWGESDYYRGWCAGRRARSAAQERARRAYSYYPPYYSGYSRGFSDGWNAARRYW